MKGITACSRIDLAMQERRAPFLIGPRITAVPILTSPFKDSERRSGMACNLSENGGVLVSTRTGHVTLLFFLALEVTCSLVGGSGFKRKYETSEGSRAVKDACLPANGPAK